MATTELVLEPTPADVVERERRLRWYVGLDQRLAHRLRYDDTGHWQQETLCGRAFWPWFRADRGERRCATCGRKGDGDGD